MTQLNNQTIKALPQHVHVPNYDRADVSPGIVHIGVGNFHRAHMAVYIDRCLSQGERDWGIIGVGLRPGSAGEEKAKAIASQDGLYTVTEYAPDGSISSRVIGSMIRYLHAPTDPEAVIQAMASPKTKIISMTITEGGYNLREDDGTFDLNQADVHSDLLPSNAPLTAFRYVVEAMKRRREVDTKGVTLLSCDNLRSNGDVTREAFIGFAKEFDPATAAWMAENVSFPNSMVDRIAPSVSLEDAANANAVSGIEDQTPVTAESFTQWVCEDDFIAGRPSLDLVGVELRPDVEQFEAIKGRMLNASHMMMSYPSALLGHEYVFEAFADTRVQRLLETFLDRTAIPLITPPSDVSLAQYRAMILERFSNKAIKDRVLRIAHDGMSKLPIFLSKTTQDVLQAGKSVEVLAFHMACFRQYFGGVDITGADFEVREPGLNDADKALIYSADPTGLLKTLPFAPQKLSEHRDYAEAFMAHLALLNAGEFDKALERAIRAT